jgi:hypothetical protein
VEIWAEEKGKDTIPPQKIKYYTIYSEGKKTDTQIQTPTK